MLKNLLILLVVGSMIACSNQPATEQQDTAEAQTETENNGYYGEKISGENPVSGQEIVSMLEEKDSVYVTFKSEIITNCQHSGCWMDLDLGNDEVVKVTFKDYAFFIPLDSKGKTATVEGYAKRETIPVDILRHYAEDDGKSKEEIEAITEPELAYTFEAVGVIIEE